MVLTVLSAHPEAPGREQGTGAVRCWRRDEASAYPLGRCGCAHETCACSPITLITHMHSQASHITLTLTVTDSNTKHVLIHSETLILLLVHAHSGPTSNPEERQSQGDPNIDAEASRNRGQRHKEVTFELSVREENHNGG